MKGGKYPIEITELLSYNSQGFLYAGKVLTPKGQKNPGIDNVVVREHFMYYCSDRGEDGCSVMTQEDTAPTVEDCLNNFKQASELRRQIAIGNSAIVDVLDCFGENNTYYYIVEYLKGETFEEYINRMGPISLDEVRALLGPILRAAAHFHILQALHSDIHPRHIRFKSDKDHKKLSLFNLYTTIHFDEEGRRLWSIQNTNCREGYAPPEQYYEIENFLPQIDVYALAATLVFALSGKHLPDSRTITEEIVRSTLPPTLPENYVSALVHSLNPDYTNRTVSVTGFFDEIKHSEESRQRHFGLAKETDIKSEETSNGLMMKIMGIIAALAAIAALLVLALIVIN